MHQHPNFQEANDVQEFCLPSGLMIAGGYDCSHLHFCLCPVYFGLKYYVDAANRSKNLKTDIPMVRRSAFDPLDGAHEDTWRVVKLAGKFRHACIMHTSTISMDEIS
jgi:hypothetical protein